MGNIVDEIKSTQDKDEMLRNALIRIIQLYPEKVHFIYELLQNAEDAEAKNIKFVLYDDRLEVMHDGKPFTLSDLRSLFNIGKSNKAENYNQIGEFGVGFKSVFTICERVLIYSNPSNSRQACPDAADSFGLEMVNFCVPNDLPQVDFGSVYTTKFVFPFAIGKEYLGFESYDKLLDEIKNKLENLSETTLLFMRKLEAIEYDICLNDYKNSGAYMLAKHTEDGFMRVQALSDNGNKKDKDATAELAYLLFSKQFELNGVMRSVDLAFAYTEDDYGECKFVKAPNKNVFVYFPTGTESKLDFIVQGPYRTTPSRSEIPINEENIYLAEKTAELVYESVLKLRDASKLNISLLNILPINTEDFYDSDFWTTESKSNNLFTPVYNKVKELFRNEDVIPARCGGFVNADHAIMVRSSDIAEVFSDDDITNLLKSNKRLHWVTEIITSTRSDMKDLYDYLTDRMGIDVVTPEYLAGRLEKNAGFLKTKARDIEWLVAFYNFLKTVPAQFSKNGRNARMLPLKLVFTEKGDFVAPFRRTDDGNYLPNVFIPTDSEDAADLEDIDLVNRQVYVRSQEFFKETLHLEKPDEYSIWFKAVKKRFEPPYNVSEEQHIKDIKNVLKYLTYPQYTNDLESMLSGRLLVRCFDNDGIHWYNPYSRDVYFAESTDGINIKGYFRNIRNVAFIDEEFYENNGIKREDLKSLNVSDVIVEGLDITCGQYNTGKPGTRPSWHSEGKFRWLLTIKDFVNALCYIEKQYDQPDAPIKSAVILRTLLKYEPCLKGDIIISGNNKPLLDESCNAVNIILKRFWHDKFGDRYANKYLNSWGGKWLYTDSGELVSSTEITKYELNKGLYGDIKPRSSIYSVLKFKEDDRDKADKLNAELESLDADKQDAFIDMLLRKKFGINLEELQTKLNDNVPIDDGEFVDDEEDFEFPEEKVKNWELIKRHSMQLFAYAEPVLYQQKLRQIKVSGNTSAIKTYLQHAYRALYSTRYFCQLCHKPFVRIESCQIHEPGQAEKELEPMHLCMCPNCAGEFRLFRAGDDYSKFLLQLKNLTEEDIESCSPVVVTTPIGEIWFTQTHIAEIIELLNLQERCKDKNEPGKSTNSGLKVAVNFSPDIAPSKHDVHSAGLLREEIAKSSIAKGNTAIGMTASPNITVLDYLGIKSNLNKEVFYCDRKYSTQSVPKVKVRLESVNNGNVTFIYLGGIKKGERATISMQVAVANKCFETFVKP